MSTKSTTKIDIQNSYADKIRKGGSAVQPFINQLLEDFYADKFVLLNEDNIKMLQSFAEKSGKDISYIVNFVLREIDLQLPEDKQKLKITVDETTVKTKIKKRIRTGMNPADW